MEDSSTNPYIPQASGALQAKVTRPQTPFARISKTALIVGGVLLVLLAAALFFLIPKTSVVDEKARADLAEVLQPSSQISKLVTIKSSLGFKVNYQDQLFTSYGEVGSSVITAHSSTAQVLGANYENADLKQERGYGLIRIRPLESLDTNRAAVTVPPELEVRSYDKNALLQTDQAKAAAADAAKQGSGASGDTKTKQGDLALSTFVSIDSAKRLGDKTSDDGTTVTIEATKPTGISINNTDYQRVRYTIRNDNYRISNERHDDCYYTIQNTQPYSACIVNVRPNSVAAASLLEQTLQMVSYQAPDKADAQKVSYKPAVLALSMASPKPATLAQDSSTDTTNDNSGDSQQTNTPQDKLTPEYIKDEGRLKAIAKNQPSVVRIATLYCANIALKMADGSTGTTLTDACTGNVSSGAFVSKDGYIATTGHAIRYSPRDVINGYINMASSRDDLFDRLERVLDYLLNSRIIQQSDVDYLKTGANTGNQDALAKIESLTSVIPSDYIQASNETYNYAIQPTDKPITLNLGAGNRPAFAYSDTVLPAKFVNADYDASKSAQNDFTATASSTDVGLLKADGLYPVVTIGAGDGLKSNQKLTTVGFPAYVDSGLAIDKVLNIPVVTESAVDQTFQQDGHSLIQSTTPVLPGNDGAPTFDETGALVGLGVYGHLYCPDQQCFANGTIRSANELSAMIDKNNIVLTNKSDISDIWAQGVDAYFASNYRVAASDFSKAGSMYGFNQVASKMSDLASSKIGSSTDTSLYNQLVGIAMVMLVVIAVGMVILGILLFVHLKRLDSLQVGHYGAAQPSFQPVAPMPQQPVNPMPMANPYGQPMQQPGQGLPTPQQYQQQAQPQQPVNGWAPSPQIQQPPTGAVQTPQPPVQGSQSQPPQDPYYRQ
jgi:S1-C subfamily serine protease